MSKRSKIYAVMPALKYNWYWREYVDVMLKRRNSDFKENYDAYADGFIAGWRAQEREFDIF